MRVQVPLRAPLLKENKILTDIWTFKYEPKKLEDMILEPELRKKLTKVVKDIPNFMLYGPAGVGKGTFTKILLKETGIDYIWINASDETGIDTIRGKVKSFAVAKGVTPLKMVVFNEASALSKGESGSQKILKQLIEDVYKVTRFCFLFNEEHMIIQELKSRCSTFKIGSPPAKDLFNFCSKILKNEKIKFDNKTVVEIIKKCYPDIRKTIQTLQENSIDGKLIDNGVYEPKTYEDVFNYMKKQNFDEIRKTLRSGEIDYVGFYKYMFDNAGEFKNPGDAIILIGEHLHKHNVSYIPEINFMHMYMRMLKQGTI